MNRIFFLLLISIFALSGCRSKTSPYWELQLPAHFNTGQPEKFAESLPDSVHNKAVTNAALFESGGVSTIIVIPLPVFETFPTLITLDKDGKEIDRLSFMNENGDAGEGWESTEDVTILPDKTIVRIDSAYAYIMDPSGNINETTRGLSVTTRKYRISDTGKIEKIEDSGL